LLFFPKRVAKKLCANQNRETRTPMYRVEEEARINSSSSQKQYLRKNDNVPTDVHLEYAMQQNVTP